MAIIPIVHPLTSLRIPYEMLGAMDSRAIHYLMQPYHYLIRVAHILTASIFFGVVVLLDCRLMGFHRSMGMRPLAEAALPWLYWTFGISFITGIALFLYDPVHVGSHGYFTPKLLMLGLGLINTAVFRRYRFGAAFTPAGTMPMSAKIAGALSLLCWSAVMIFAMLNTEAAPNVLLQY
ncbi:MAG TPA: hypothetical protein VL752_03965 [Acidisoma sp.]|uniref:hypothetical protein n=1 Tax=Acidisoma sp. TaxID=1872115 RepID=UPI002B625702|nr:hypothetical protein [Acidisoma sp.]HTI00083.1 hypothetical protein [Acidisoma sp.]